MFPAIDFADDDDEGIDYSLAWNPDVCAAAETPVSYTVNVVYSAFVCTENETEESREDGVTVRIVDGDVVFWNTEKILWSISPKTTAVRLKKDYVGHTLEIQLFSTLDVYSITFPTNLELHNFSDELRGVIYRSSDHLPLKVGFYPPPCAPHALTAINELICRAPTDGNKSKVVSYLFRSDYLPQLMSMFRMASKEETFENKTTITNLHDLFVSIVRMNVDTFQLFLFSERNILDTVACIEADRLHPYELKEHYDFLYTATRNALTEDVLPSELSAHIQYAFQLEYVNEHVLCKLFEEDQVRSHIDGVLRRVKVIIHQMIIEDSAVSEKIMRLLQEEDILPKTRIEIFKFFREFNYSLSKESRDLFHCKMFERGLLDSVVHNFRHESLELRLAAIETAHIFSKKWIFQLFLQQESGGESLGFLRALIREMMDMECFNAGLSFKIYVFLEYILDNYEHETLKSPMIPQACQVLSIATAEVLGTAGHVLQECGPNQAEIWSFVIRILRISAHINPQSFEVKEVLTNHAFISSLMPFVKSRYTFLGLEVVKLLKAFIEVEPSDDYAEFIINGNLFRPVIEAYLKHYGTDNAFESAVKSLFECVMNVKSETLVNYVIDAFGKELEICETLSHVFLQNRYGHVQAQQGFRVMLEQKALGNQEISVDAVDNGSPKMDTDEEDKERSLTAQSNCSFYVPTILFPELIEEEDLMDSSESEADLDQTETFDSNAAERGDANVNDALNATGTEEFEEPVPARIALDQNLNKCTENTVSLTGAPELPKTTQPVAFGACSHLAPQGGARFNPLTAVAPPVSFETFMLQSTPPQDYEKMDVMNDYFETSTKL